MRVARNYQQGTSVSHNSKSQSNFEMKMKAIAVWLGIGKCTIVYFGDYERSKIQKIQRKYKGSSVHVEFKMTTWSSRGVYIQGKVPNVSTWCSKWSHFVLHFVFLGFGLCIFADTYVWSLSQQNQKAGERLKTPRRQLLVLRARLGQVWVSGVGCLGGLTGEAAQIPEGRRATGDEAGPDRPGPRSKQNNGGGIGKNHLVHSPSPCAGLFVQRPRFVDLDSHVERIPFQRAHDFELPRMVRT